MATYIGYSVVLYRFLGGDNLDGSIFHLTASEDIPEGAVVAITTTGLAKRCALAEVPVGVAIKPTKAGMELTIETNCIVENRVGASLALTPGTRVYTAANGTVSATATGATQVGVAMTANKVRITI